LHISFQDLAPGTGLLELLKKKKAKPSGGARGEGISKENECDFFVAVAIEAFSRIKFKEESSFESGSLN